MNVIRLMKKSLAALLLAFVLGAMLPACSSSEEEDSSGGEKQCPEGSERDYPECLEI